ncbi:MAG: hypothetical protein HOD60_11040, partial [Candidatus Nitrosopelagicus sp.]|nr:hypothetical protein [Candidatus Nitrosopelagicus sp.]
MKLFFLLLLLVVTSGFVFADAFAYTISDDPTGGDCSTIGTWDSGSKTCSITSDITSQLIVNSNGITLDGGGGTFNIISGSGPLISGDTVSDIVIQNFNVVGNVDRQATNFRDSDNIIIQQNTFTDVNYGVSAMDISNLQIQSNTFSASANSIEVTNSNGVTITDNIFEHCLYRCVNLQASNTSSLISENTFSTSSSDIPTLFGNPVSFFTIQVGWGDDGVGTHTISDNTLTGDGTSGLRLVSTGPTAVVTGNTFSNFIAAISICERLLNDADAMLPDCSPNTANNQFSGNTFSNNDYDFVPEPVPEDGEFTLPCSMQEAGDGVSAGSCHGFYTN